MPVRTFRDEHGTLWRVWSTMPDASSPLSEYYPGGWLTFDRGADSLRRLSPAPAGWESAAEDRLALMCKVAAEVPRHTGERLKMERPERAAGLPAPIPTQDEPPPLGSTRPGDEKLEI